MTDLEKQKIRQRLWGYLSPEVGACAGMTLAQLQQTLSWTYKPTDTQWAALSRRLQMNKG
jgi:hypothetical protein